MRLQTKWEYLLDVVGFFGPGEMEMVGSLALMAAGAGEVFCGLRRKKKKAERKMRDGVYIGMRLEMSVDRDSRRS
jgi:hypothetical protein